MKLDESVQQSLLQRKELLQAPVSRTDMICVLQAKREAHS
jgi:hypothetical protein